MHPVAHIPFVAMDRATSARAFMLAILASVQSLVGIHQQGAALLAQLLVLFFFSAIKLNHALYYHLFSFYSMSCLHLHSSDQILSSTFSINPRTESLYSVFMFSATRPAMMQQTVMARCPIKAASPANEELSISKLVIR